MQSISDPTTPVNDATAADRRTMASVILDTARLLFEPDQVVELRALNVGGGNGRPCTMSGYFSDHARLAEEAAALAARATGVYVTFNPVDPALLARRANRTQRAGTGEATSDRDILGRRWLYVDFDSVRPAGISSTEREHAAALVRALQVSQTLETEGWPKPILADSGNGAHALYRVDLPVDDDGLVRRVLDALAFRFGDGTVTIDTATYNPARLARLYGTRARKGDDLPDRPHRMSQVLEVPGSVNPVPRELLAALAARVPPPPAGSAKGGFDLDAWVARHVQSRVQGPFPWNGGRKWVFDVCPWNPQHTNRSAYLVQFANGAVAAGCHHNGCKDHNWLTLRDLLEPGRHTHAGRDRRPDVVRPGAKGVTAEDLMRMELPEPKYIISGLVVEGLTAFAGRPKIRKSWEVVSSDVAVATGGRALGQISVEQGEVLLLALEDPLRRLQDRLRKILRGAPAPKALTMFTEWPRLHQGGLDKLHDWLTAHPDARLVDIDTLTKVLPPRKRHADPYEADYDIGGRLQRLAFEHHVGVRFTCHTRKPIALEGDWLDEVLGSTGITGVTDSVLVLKRARGQHDATLFVTGRDLEEQELALRWDPQTGLWTLIGKAEEVTRSKERAEIVQALRNAPGGMTPAAVAKTLGKDGKDRDAVKVTMYRMWQDGDLVNDRGTYRVRERE